MTDFAKTRQMFDIPEGVIYLNGNSLGPMPKAAPKAINSFLMDEWRTELVRGWNTKNWFMQSNTLGDRLGRLIGAQPAVPWWETRFRSGYFKQSPPRSPWRQSAA